MSGLVLAAGSGRRFNGSPKAFLAASGVTLIERAVSQVGRFSEEVLAGLPPDRLSEATDLVGDRAVVVAGGSTRLATLRLLVEASKGTHVLVHDVARPLASDALFRDVVDLALDQGAATAARPYVVRDSIALSAGGVLERGVDRNRVVTVQTPSVFRREILVEALSMATEREWGEMGIPTLVARAGFDVHLLETREDNIKVTYRSDWETVERTLLGADQEMPDRII